ncbi:MAG: DUF1992 domain-containing protein [Planctomycetes bacterium]|nr:DUF1992 domain-containing protein [Planctomycetota bacterium]
MGWYLFVERLLSEAQERGEFSNLPDAGKPIDLAENPFAPADWRLANKILKDNQLLPEFLERRKNLERLAQAVEDLVRRHDRQFSQLTVRCARHMRDLAVLFPIASELMRFLAELPIGLTGARDAADSSEPAPPAGGAASVSTATTAAAAAAAALPLPPPPPPTRDTTRRRRATERARAALADLIPVVRQRNALVADTLWRYRKLLEETNAEIGGLNSAIARDNQFNLGSLQRAPLDVDARLHEFARRYPAIPPPPDETAAPGGRPA